jgi:DNA ligase-1
VKSCDHIIQAVRQVFGVGWVVFGEVWKEGTPQAEISGMFRRHNAEPSLVFVVFDIVPSGSFAIGIHDVPYDTRLRHICLQLRQLRNMPNLPLREVAYYTPGSYGDPQKLANFLVAEGGYDGLILRDLRSHWVQAEAKEGELIKVKPVKSFDLRCTGVEEGLGKMAGIAGKLLFDFKGVTIKAGGGDFDKRREWFANPPVGRIFEVECLEVTLDGKLREPRLKGERFDKVKADGE